LGYYPNEIRTDTEKTKTTQQINKNKKIKTKETHMKRGTPSTKKRTFMLNLKSIQKQTISEKRKSKRIMSERERERA
jgi:hypothetical protein